MPVQSDRAEPVTAKSGDPTKDTIGAKLYGYAGRRETQTRRETESRGSNLKRTISKICVSAELYRSSYNSGNDVSPKVVL